jgi:hypothetical protein
MYFTNILYLCQPFLEIFLKIMAHNVPAVYDVFASPIKETVGFQGLQKCGWSEAWERSDLAERNPEPP